MSQVINSWEDFTDGQDGTGGINKAVEKAVALGLEAGVRVKVVFRTQEQGTPSFVKLSEIRFDPKNTQVMAIKRSIVQTLEDNPGQEFSGKIRIDFQNGDDSTSYSSFQRSVKIGSVAHFEPGEDDDGSNFADEILSGGGSGMSGASRDEIIEHYKALLSEKDNAIKRQAASTDAAMGFLFKSQANMLAMFDRSTRMLETYTLRFGFPQMPPQIIESGSVNREPAPAPAAGGGGMGLLPMLLQAAAQFAKADGPAPAPQAPPQAQQRQIGRAPSGQANRMEAVNQGASSVRSMRPQPARPAEGFDPPPRIQEEGSSMGHHQEMTRHEEPRGHRFEQPEEEYEDDASDEGDYEGDDEEVAEAATQQLNKISPEEMKALVLNWVNASPENKQAALSMGSDLMTAIMS
jgi:hypothetical protein